MTIDKKFIDQFGNPYSEIIVDKDGTIAINLGAIGVPETYVIDKNQKILIDPHTAIGIGAIKKIPLEGKTVVLATAHPAKFSKAVMAATNVKPELPGNLTDILIAKENYDKLPADLEKIKKYILKMQSYGGSILITDHQVKNLFDIVDRAYVLGEQSIIAEGTPNEILKSSKAIQLYFGNQYSSN